MAEPFAPQCPSVDATVRPHPTCLGDIDRSRAKRLRDPLDAPDEGCADLQETGNLRAVQLLLGHTRVDSTVQYLGIDLDNAMTLSGGIDL